MPHLNKELSEFLIATEITQQSDKAAFRFATFLKALTNRYPARFAPVSLCCQQHSRHGAPVIESFGTDRQHQGR